MRSHSQLEMNLIKNIYAFLLFSCFSIYTFAFPCYLTLIKDDCWQGFDVTFRAFDVTNEEVLVDFSIPPDELWGRRMFECNPKQTFRFEAEFSPVIWQDDAGRKYPGKRYWSTPENINGAVGWNISVCFSDDFSSVPMPPTATRCRCDRTVAPPISDQKSS